MKHILPQNLIIFLLNQKELKQLFLVNKNKHENEGALIGNKIDNSNKDQIIDRILRIL